MLKERLILSQDEQQPALHAVKTCCQSVMDKKILQSKNELCSSCYCYDIFSIELVILSILPRAASFLRVGVIWVLARYS